MRTPSHVLTHLGRVPLAVTAAAALALTMLGQVPGHPGSAGAVERAPQLRPAAATTYSAPRIRLVQANLRIGTAATKFQADVRKVLSTNPDFVTYNEVQKRHDSILAPGKYDLWRAGGDYQGETAVAWDSTKWHAVAHGDTVISWKKGKPKGQNFDWGVRYANWVTLKSTAGRTVSVIAAHFAPDTKYTRNLTKPSARKLGALADKLGRKGPVLIGGDLNVGYHSKNFPRAIFAQHRIVPTYDVLQKRAITSGSNGTIDYVMARGMSQFGVGRQFALSLYSDHNAVGADFSALPTSVTASAVRFGVGTVMSEPTGGTAGRRVIMRMAIKAVRSTPKGAAIHLSTRALNAPTLVNSLVAARKRGVRVQVLTGNPQQTAAEKGLSRLLGTNVKANNWAVNRPGALGNLPVTTLLISKTGLTPAFRLSTGVTLTQASATGTNRATISASKGAYDNLFRPFFAAVGRRV